MPASCHALHPMPIRFQCEQCGQKLSVGSRKSGQHVSCPKCHQSCLVPEAEAPSDAVLPGADEAAAGEQEEFAIRVDPNDWIYVEDEGTEFSAAANPDKLAVPRSMVYLQGVLLGAVGILAFVLGLLFGASWSARDELSLTAPQPCNVRGKITFRDDSGRTTPDGGSVVIVVPESVRPDRNAKFPIDQLRPGEIAPQPEHATLRAIRSLGGDYVRTNSDGEYEFSLPDSGKYFVLVLSRGKRRAAPQRLSPRDIAEMGRYFLTPDQLVGDQQYEWRRETLRGAEARVDVVF